MKEKFDYAKALSELDGIARKVEDPATSLDEIDSLVTRSKALITACRDYLHGLQEKIDTLSEN